MSVLPAILFGQVKDERDFSGYGKVEYATTDTASYDARRVSISQRYDRQGWVFTSVHPGTGGVGRVKEEEPPPLIPINESSLIVIGRIGKVEAFLSNDKRGVYSEFMIEVDEVLKKDPRQQDDKRIVADREGGVVIYSGPQRVRYGNSDQAVPVPGHSYLFFLTTDSVSPNYSILTSYELTSTGFRQMEMGRSLAEFKDMSKEEFLKAIRQQIVKTYR
jgi:hypothetical protein